MAIGKVNVNSGNGNGEVLIEFNNYTSSNPIGSNQIVLELPIGSKYKFTEHNEEIESIDTSILVNSPATGYIKLNSGVITTKQLSETLGKIWNPINIDSDLDENPIDYAYYDNGRILLTLYNGDVYYSMNGIDFIKSSLGSSDMYISGFFYINGISFISSSGGMHYSIDDGMTWAQITSVQNSFDSMAYVENIWVASAYYGILYSIDGITWIQSNITDSVDNCYYSNNIWVAVVDGVGIYYSTDGITWTQSNINEGNYTCYYSNNIWVASNSTNSYSYNYNGIYHSIDGMNWILSNITEGNYRCYYENNKWVALTDNLIYTSYKSDDGITWYPIYEPNMIINKYKFDNPNIMLGNMGGRLYYSIDDTTWMASNISGIINDIYYSNNMYFVKLNGKVYCSSNGIDWTETDITGSIWGVKFVHDKWFINISSKLYYSTDGITWIISSAVNISDEDVHYNNNIWIGRASLSLYHSVDGTSWTAVTPNRRIRNLYYNNGVWVAHSTNPSHEIFYSTNGTTWSGSGSLNTNSVRDLKYNNEMWVVITSGGIYYTPNGSSLTLVSNTLDIYFDKLYYYNDMWFAISSNHGIYYSTDGITWTRVMIYSLTDIRYNNTFIAYGDNKGIYYSTDGITWTQSNIKTGGLAFDPYYVNNIWYIEDDSYTKYYSTDGITWNVITNINGSFSSIEYVENMWFADSRDGLCYSTDGITWVLSNLYEQTDSIEYINNKWIINNRSFRYYSDDGATWVIDGFNDGNYHFSYFNNILFAYSGTFILNYNNEMKKWEIINNFQTAVDYIINHGHILVAYTGAGAYYSDDCITWELSNIELSAEVDPLDHKKDIIWLLSHDDGNTTLHYSI